MLVTMRSWDLVWGLGYDVPCFAAMQAVAASALAVPIGEYAHVAGSGHLYERHWDLEPRACNDQLFVTAFRDLGETRRYALAAMDLLAGAIGQGERGIGKLARVSDGRATGVGWQDALKAWLKKLTTSERS
jgi:hypothetical protein